MKKSFVFLPLLIIPFLGGCSNENKAILTYGTFVNETAPEINGSTLKDKMSRENFLLAIHPEESSCRCWTSFSTVIDLVNKNLNLLIYKIHYKEITDDLYKLGFERFDNKASFYIVANNKIVKSYNYGDDNAGNIFIKESALKEAVEKDIKLPKIYQVNEAQLNSKISETSETFVYYYKEKCPDCTYFTPKELIPYINSNDIKDNIYAIDISLINKDVYQDFKDNHFLSTKYNTAFGYNTGYVPTMQYYKDHKLEDMMVYFNDTIENGVIIDSYYSVDRLDACKYLSKSKIQVLTGTKLKDEEMNTEKNAWISSEVQASYYSGFANAFLETYLKK